MRSQGTFPQWRPNVHRLDISEIFDERAPLLHRRSKGAAPIINGIPFGQKSVYGSSSVTSYYQDTDGFLFCVKDLHENKLLSLCDGCNVTCKEYFYAIRVEQRHNNMFVRLCIDRNDGNSYMPLRHFLSSNQLKDIMKIVKTNGDRKELV